MDVALINEGTYPYVKGGVSQWCDKLIRGLPEHTFRLVTLVANGTEKQTWELPDNAEGVRSFPLWGPAATPRRGRHQARVADAARAVLAGSVLAQPVTFEWGLRELAKAATGRGFARELRACDLAGDLLEIWPGAEPLTVYDAIVAAELVERSLLPLRVDLGPRARVDPRGGERSTDSGRSGGEVASRYSAGDVGARRLSAGAVPGLPRSALLGRGEDDRARLPAAVGGTRLPVGGLRRSGGAVQCAVGAPARCGSGECGADLQRGRAGAVHRDHR